MNKTSLLMLGLMLATTGTALAVNPLTALLERRENQENRPGIYHRDLAEWKEREMERFQQLSEETGVVLRKQKAESRRQNRERER